MAKKPTAEQRETAVNEITYYGEALKKSIKLSFAFLCEEPKQMSNQVLDAKLGDGGNLEVTSGDWNDFFSATKGVYYGSAKAVTDFQEAFQPSDKGVMKSDATLVSARGKLEESKQILTKFHAAHKEMQLGQTDSSGWRTFSLPYITASGESKEVKGRVRGYAAEAFELSKGKSARVVGSQIPEDMEPLYKALVDRAKILAPQLFEEKSKGRA